MFSSNDTPEEEFKYANEIGGIINLDDITHIESVEKAVGNFRKQSAAVIIQVECLKSVTILWIIPEMQNTE